ncbi:MAG: T9SS type A sorting domain-containing protein [Bacteroidales bacterium]
MKKNTLCFIAMLGFAGIFNLHAQTLSPTVISSSGGYFTSASASLSFTVAEMTMVQTFTSPGNNILTQGFQQPEDLIISISETPTVSGDVLIYPNPTNGAFTLSYFNNGNSETTIKLYNLVGQIVLSKPIAQITGLNTVKFDINSFSQGIYMLELTVVDAKGEKPASPAGRKTNYYKINLVY